MHKLKNLIPPSPFNEKLSFHNGTLIQRWDKDPSAKNYTNQVIRKLFASTQTWKPKVKIRENNRLVHSDSGAYMHECFWRVLTRLIRPDSPPLLLPPVALEIFDWTKSFMTVIAALFTASCLPLPLDPFF